MRTINGRSFWRCIPLLVLSLLFGPTEPATAQWPGPNGGWGWIDYSDGFCREECTLYYTLCECWRMPDVIVEG